MDAANERMAKQRGRDRIRVAHVTLHAHVQCLQAAPQQEAVEWRRNAAHRYQMYAYIGQWGTRVLLPVTLHSTIEPE